MRVLLDTHVLLWALADPARLSQKAAQLLLNTNNSPVISSASVWELAIKFQAGKLPQAGVVLSRLEYSLARLGAAELQISHAHAVKAASLPLHHKDPFDRMLIAQTIAEGLPLISADAVFQDYEVLTVW